MILHIPGRGVPLTEYGILIPSSPGRTGKILDALSSHPVLGPRKESWLLGSDGSTITREDLERAHATDYVDKLFTADGLEEVLLSVYELIDSEGKPNRYDPSRATRPLSEMFDRSFVGLSGTYQCGRRALDHRFCFYLGGGAHHGHREFGHGFCIVNDSVVAIRKLQAENRIRSAWVIDVDVHKGDGTAALTESDPTVRTLSVHMAAGWPLDLPEFSPEGDRNPWFIESDIDVPIAPGEEAEYNKRLTEALNAMDEFGPPDCAYVLGGADPYEKDELPSTQLMKLSLDQITERNIIIYEFLKARKIPQAWLTAGGYGESAWEAYPPFMTYALLDNLGLS